MKLKNNQEIVGTLENYSKEKNIINLVFQIHKTIELPLNSISIKNLETCKNKRISKYRNY